MPKKRKRGKKQKKRRLWLNVKASGITVSKKEFVRILAESIRAGDYELPEEWNVTLEWRNKQSAPMRSGNWQEEMKASKESSDGFDRAVTKWLQRKMR